MLAGDCAPGRRVVIGGKYLRLGTAHDPLGPLFGVIASVIAATGTPGEEYPHGMVALELPEDTSWPVRQVFVGPEDLAPVPGEA